MSEKLGEKESYEKVAKRVMKIRGEVSAVLGRNLDLHTYIEDVGVLQSKLLDSRRKDGRELLTVTLDKTKDFVHFGEEFKNHGVPIMTDSKALCRVEIDWSKIPEVEKYELARLSRSTKFKLSAMPVLDRMIFRKEKQMMVRIINIVADTMRSDADTLK